MAQVKKEKDDKQELIDICFQMVMVAVRHKPMAKMTNDEIASWVAQQLRDCGYDTQPMGMSWGVLKK